LLALELILDFLLQNCWIVLILTESKFHTQHLRTLSIPKVV